MYSDIIAPEVYNHLMSVHAYIAASDRAIAQVLRAGVGERSHQEVIEVGCGPGRILPQLKDAVPYARVRGVDYDPVFVAYAQRDHGDSVVCADVLEYEPESPVHAIVSQGFHHHVAKNGVHQMLARLRSWLVRGGVYIVGDEFLPHYQSEEERRLRCAAWYCHIIANALRKGEELLAREETKTLLDDLQIMQKTERDIAWVLSACVAIDQEWRVGSHALAVQLLIELEQHGDRAASGDRTLDLSRGDYKIDHQRFIAEVEHAGFRVASVQTFGPHLLCGSMSVFVLQK